MGILNVSGILINKKSFKREERGIIMIWTIIGVIILLWVLGLVFKVAAGFIHILLIIAVILILVKVFKGGNRM
jgi:hypothetical protein